MNEIPDRPLPNEYSARKVSIGNSSVTVADLSPSFKLGKKMFRTGRPRLGAVGETKCG